MTRLHRYVASVGLGAAIVAIVSLHVLSPEFDPARRFMSEYVLGRWGWMMRVAFFGLAVGGAALGHSFLREGRRLSALGMLGWTIGMVVAGVCTTDASLPGRVRTVVGMVHDCGADGAFLSIVAAQLAGPRIGRVVAPIMVCAVVALNLMGLPGVGQRVFGALAVGWQLAVLFASRAERDPLRGAPKARKSA